VESNTLQATINSGRVGREKFWVNIPGPVQFVALDGAPMEDYVSQAGVISFEIQLGHQNDFTLAWD
jgi:hypothetical protein